MEFHVLIISLNSLASSHPDAPPPDPKKLAEQLTASANLANGRPVQLDIDYLVKGLLSRKEVSVLYGPSNCGKSTLATTIGMAVIRGVPFAGMSTRRSAVLHIAPEGATSVLAATSPYIGEGQLDDAEPYIVQPLRMDLRDSLHARTLVELVRLHESRLGCEIGLIVVDTLVLSIGDADENSSRDVTAAMFNAARISNMTGAHVMCLHHTNKGGDLRGSSAILAASDTTLELSLTKDEADQPIARVRQVKQKTLPKGGDIRFRLRSEGLGTDSEGEERTTAIIDVLQGKGQAAPEAAEERKAPATGARHAAVLAAMTALSADPAAAQTRIRAQHGSRLLRSRTFRNVRR
jgi:energy-coupling factor transporter ATP-binding protein EcfA2